MVTNQLIPQVTSKERSDLEFRLSSLKTAILTLERSIQKREASWHYAIPRAGGDGHRASSSSEEENRPPEGEDHAKEHRLQKLQPPRETRCYA